MLNGDENISLCFHKSNISLCDDLPSLCMCKLAGISQEYRPGRNAVSAWPGLS